MSDSSPNIVKLTWPLVFGLMAVEAASLAIACGLLWFFLRVSPTVNDDASLHVRQVLDAQVAAWNSGDLEGYMAGYWNDERLSFFSGNDVTTGWKATLERYRKRYQGEGKAMGHLTFADLDVKPLCADRAECRGRWKVGFPDGKSAEGLFTLLLRKFDDGWRIIHDHTSAKSP